MFSPESSFIPKMDAFVKMGQFALVWNAVAILKQVLALFCLMIHCYSEAIKIRACAKCTRWQERVGTF
jgi:hypothetical protein